MREVRNVLQLDCLGGFFMGCLFHPGHWENFAFHISSIRKFCSARGLKYSNLGSYGWSFATEPLRNGFWLEVVGNYYVQKRHCLIPYLVPLDAVLWVPWKDNPLLILKTCIAPLLIHNYSLIGNDQCKVHQCLLRGQYWPFELCQSSKMTSRAS